MRVRDLVKELDRGREHLNRGYCLVYYKDGRPTELLKHVGAETSDFYFCSSEGAHFLLSSRDLSNVEIVDLNKLFELAVKAMKAKAVLDKP